MKWITTVLVLLIVAGGYLALQQPEIRTLFTDTEKAENPLDFLDDLPEVNSRPVVKKSHSRQSTPLFAGAPAATTDARSDESAEEPDAVKTDSLSNIQTARILIQILKAKDLVSGISLNVSDDAVEVFGEVDSRERKQDILAILEKGRGARELRSDQLRIRAGE